MIASERRPRFKTITLILLLIVSGAATGFAAPAHDYWMYVGSDTSQGGKGIYAFRFHAATGRVEPAGLAAGRFWQANANASWNSIPRMLSQIRAGWPNLKSVVRGVQVPVFLAAHPNGRYLFASDEFPVYSVTAFRIDPSTGKLTILNSTSSAGNGTLAVDKAGRNVVVACIQPGESITENLQASLFEWSAFTLAAFDGVAAFSLFVGENRPANIGWNCLPPKPASSPHLDAMARTPSQR